MTQVLLQIDGTTSILPFVEYYHVAFDSCTEVFYKTQKRS